jgi:hypothetical protein
MGWARLTRPRGAADGSISWIRAWEKLLVQARAARVVAAAVVALEGPRAAAASVAAASAAATAFPAAPSVVTVVTTTCVRGSGPPEQAIFGRFSAISGRF